ncbi:MAG: hypothetical protein GY749_02570 [Desulfobacteraceae bacterium]|nr:hypothetical protein [Desulfobacteraceae bacterium]
MVKFNSFPPHFSLPSLLTSLTSHFSLLTSHFSLLTSHFSLPTSHFPLPTSHFPLPTSHFSLLTSHFSHFKVNVWVFFSLFSSIVWYVNSVSSYSTRLTSSYCRSSEIL